jgi:uncharacterized protein DUF3854
MNPHLDFLLSVLYARDPLTAEHLADLRKSGLSDATIERQCFRSVPPSMIDQLLGFSTPGVRSAYILPYPDPRGGWFDHVRLKIFPSYVDANEQTVKYLQPKRSGSRPYFPLATLTDLLEADGPIYFVEGEKKAAAVAQLGLTAIGFAGIEGWHAAGVRALLPDFDLIPLIGRVVELVPDGDIQTNPHVERGARRLGAALETRGARVRIVLLPMGVAA